MSVGALAEGDLEDALAWRQGYIVCNGMAVSEALSRFAHYHGRVITTSPAAAVRTVGGRYPLGDLDGFLAFLEQGKNMNMRVEHGVNGEVHVSLATEP